MKPAYNIQDLRGQAKRKLPRAIWEFVERGTEDERQLTHNIDALARVKLVPRMLRDVSKRDQSRTLFGRTMPLPLVIAPTGVADLVSHRGESALAKAAATTGIPFSLATSSTTSIEEIAACATAGFWMQMYLWERRDLSWAVVDRALAAGAETLVVTVDMPVFPNREFNLRNGMSNPIKPNPTLALDFMAHPRWLLSVLGRYMLAGGLPRFANYPAEIGSKVTGKVSRQSNSASVNWADIAELRKRWPKNLVVKGLLHPDDAKQAAALGVDGVVVSNHGGRNFDASPASIDVLGDIVDAVGGQVAVLFDGGVRRGSDILKALAIGADAVLIGRATLYGLGAGGQAGAAKALAILANELDVAMAMLGLTALSDIDRSFVHGGIGGAFSD